MEFHCSGRTWTWLVAETSDPGIREALAEENLTRKEHIGNGFLAYFRLTRPEAGKTLALLEELEALRASDTIKLVDGPELAHVLLESGIGVRKTTISIPRLDTGALEERLEAEQG